MGELLLVLHLKYSVKRKNIVAKNSKSLKDFFVRMASTALIVIFVLTCSGAIASQGHEKLKVTLNGEVKERWMKSEGTYILAPNLLNDKPYWLKETGLQAIWYDKVFKK